MPDDSAVATAIGTTTVDGPAVTVDRTAATRIIAPVTGAGWFAQNGCCTPNIHRNVRIGAGTRIARPELFAIDWMQLDGDRVHSGDGTSNTDYAFLVILSAPSPMARWWISATAWKRARRRRR